MNLAMKLLQGNPMDDWRRKEVQDAKAEVDRRVADVEADVGKGNLLPEDVELVKSELSIEVDVSSILNPNSDTFDETRGIAENKGGGSVEMEDGGGRTVMEDGVITGLTGPTGQVVDPNTAIQEQKDSEAPAPGSETTESLSPRQILMGAEGNAVSKIDSLGGIAFAQAEIGSQNLAKNTAGFGAAGQALKDDGSGRGALDKTGKPASLALPVKGKESPRLAAVKKAIAKIKPRTAIRALASTKGGPDLKVTGFLPGGAVIKGDFGPGIVAVQLKETDEGYEVVELTENGLWKLYLELAFYWLLVLIPVGYFAYRWASTDARFRSFLHRTGLSHS